MNFKPILIISGQPKSIFFEIFFKSLKLNNFNSPIVLITCKKLLISKMKKFKFQKKVNEININNLSGYKLNNKFINIINVPLNLKSNSINTYINKSFEIAFYLINNGFSDKLLNGPISKKLFLKGKFPGITEFIAKKFNKKKIAMLIYNKKLSVCPVTTHSPLKLVSKSIKKKTIEEKVILIDEFFKKKFKLKPRIAVLGLNPHCESFDKFNEDEKIIAPTINKLKKLSYKIYGPFASDTMFIKKNREKYDVVVGMYHDQVLTPIKTLFEYDAVNITLGLPFTRVSPDHGPNEKMVDKNNSNPLSLIKSISFLDQH